MVLAIHWHGPVAQVELSRPERLNALNGELVAALVETAGAIGGRRDCRAVVISGAGRAFCSGIDLDALRTASAGGNRTIDIETEVADGANIAQAAVLQWRELPMPVIAAVHGVAFGGGLQLALGADVRIVAPDARLALKEINWGLVPDMAGMVLLPNLVAPDVLADLVLTGREVGGDEAVRIGLATIVTSDPVGAALDYAYRLAALSPDAIRAAKRLMGSTGDRAAVLRSEAREQLALFGGANQLEAVAAGVAGRVPIFAD